MQLSTVRPILQPHHTRQFVPKGASFSAAIRQDLGAHAKQTTGVHFGNRDAWVDPTALEHPLFDNEQQIVSLRNQFHRSLMASAYEGVKKLKIDPAAFMPEGTPEPTTRAVWEAALSAHKYGRNYWMSRHQAKQSLELVNRYAPQLDAIGESLKSDGLGNRAWNYAVHSLIKDKRWQVTPTDDPVMTACAITPRNHREILVKPSKWVHQDPTESLKNPKPFTDFHHDISHWVLASLHPSLYGSGYVEKLAKRPASDLELMTSPDYFKATTQKPPPIKSSLIASS